MKIVAVIIVAAIVFGVCFLVDKGFTKLFRSRQQHISGTAVRLSKRYGSFGLIIGVLGVAAIFAGIAKNWMLLAGGVVLVLLGMGLVCYYMSYAVFYDADTFLFTSLGKKNKTYYYRDICQQQLYNNQGYLLIELHMADGDVVQLQSTMDGCYDFMDHAFQAWLRQTGKKQEDCPYYDPDNSCWFPPVEA